MFYALADMQNGGQLMNSGLNTTSKEELKKHLLSYMSGDFEPKDLEVASEYSLESLANWWQFEILESEEEFKI